VTRARHGSEVRELPNDLEILITRAFEAPIALVFDVLTKPEHVRKWFAPRGEEITECSIDLRVGGSYHVVFVTDDGTECSFRGTYLEIEPPTRTVATWLFDGWPDVDAVESVDLHEADGVTTMTNRMTFSDKAGRDKMIPSEFDGVQASFDLMEDHLRSLLDSTGAVSE
jgi:uncharacterized protein YndB with AHSA1/START domain